MIDAQSIFKVGISSKAEFYLVTSRDFDGIIIFAIAHAISVAPSDFDSENFCSEIPTGIGKASEFRSDFRFFLNSEEKFSENIFRNINRNSEFSYNSE